MHTQVWLAGKTGGYKPALFDTGSDVTLVDAKIATQLDLPFTGRIIKLKGLFGGGAVGYEATATIFIPETQVRLHTRVYVPDTPVDGIIIGRDVMRDAKLKMEFLNGERITTDHNLNPKSQPPKTNNAITALAGLAVGSLAVVGAVTVLDWLFGGKSKKRRSNYE